MAERFVVVGPPGCGKTTWASRQVEHAVQKYGPQGALVCSLTKAAASEVAGRSTGIDPSMIGTLHHFAYGGVGDRKVFGKDHLCDFNKTSRNHQISEEFVKYGKVKTDGDRSWSRSDVKRSKCVPENLWTIQERAFSIVFREFKKKYNLVDFTDMIELAITDMPIAPGAPAVIIVDEAQDTNTLEWKLIDRWASNCEKLIIVGDPYQSLFDWRGADVSPLLDEEPFTVLSQSYRVPKAVHKYAAGIIKKMGREAPEYKPRDAPGLVKKVPASFKSPESLLRLIEDHVSGGRSIMILASCDYMLTPVTKWLRSLGFPYHNPYSTGRWSPLRSYGRFETSISTAQRLAAYMSPTYRMDKFWSLEDFKMFAPLLATGAVLLRGAKTSIAKIDSSTDYVTREDVAQLMRRFIHPEVIPKMAQLDPLWFRANAVASKQKTLEYPVAILKRFGHNALIETPSIIVGTIHSVKGGEADSVIIFPDLSGEGQVVFERPGWTGRDSIHRMFYVAVTRAREELYLTAAENPWRAYNF